MSANKPKPLWLQLLVDLGVLGIGLCLFSFFHHVRYFWNIRFGSPPNKPSVVITKPPAPSTEATGPVSTTAAATTAAATTATAVSATTTAPIPTLDTSGQFGKQFGQLFTEKNNIISTDTAYISHNVRITLKEETAQFGSRRVLYFVYDIYVRNIENLFTVASTTQRKPFTELLSGQNILAAISGDYCGNRYAAREVIRNGVELRASDTVQFDVCVLYWDGTMEVLTPEQYDRQAILAKAPYQLWNFGPNLLNPDGSPITDFSHRRDIGAANPRSAIGYFEPGHYCFVTVDGRSPDSAGLNLANLSKLMNRLGCKQAYNLDGGASTYGYFNGRLLRNSDPGKPPRLIYDVICVGEV